MYQGFTLRVAYAATSPRDFKIKETIRERIEGVIGLGEGNVAMEELDATSEVMFGPICDC